MSVPLDKTHFEAHGQHMLTCYRILCLSIVLVLCLSGCQNKEIPYSERSLDTIYTAGLKRLHDEDYVRSSEEFAQVEQQYPYSDWAPKAQIMSGYALYLGQKYTRAIGTLENFLYLHPYHPYADYAHYMMAMSYYQQMDNVGRNMQNSENAFEAFGVVVNRYGKTRYAQDARDKRAEVYNYLAAHHIIVGRFYQKKRLFIAAIKSYQKVVKNFPDSLYQPESLYRIVECALSLGLRAEAEKARDALTLYFKQSPWHQRADALLASSASV